MRACEPPPTPGKLDSRADEGKDEDEHGVLKAKSGEFAAKTEANKIVDGNDQEPMSGGDKDSEEQIAPGTNGLHATCETRE